MSEFSSAQYWKQRYELGQNSGAGSYGRLSVYKANFINVLVELEGIESVVELGSGDGNQASLFEIPKYTGIDVSDICVKNCSDRFRNRKNWSFQSADAEIDRHDASLSLDVIYHLVEDDVFDAYMRRLFSVADRLVVIYASDFDQNTGNRHVRHRAYSNWIAANAPGWTLYCDETNPFHMDRHGASARNSFASFKVFERVKRDD